MFLAVKALATLMLAVGIGSLGISGYVFFVALPPILSTIDQTADYLASLKMPDVNLQESAQSLRKYANSFPDCVSRELGGCAVFDLRESKASLNDFASSLESMSSDISTSVIGLQAQINQTGSQMQLMRPMLMATVGWMMATSLLLTLSGVAFLAIVKNLEKQLAQRAVQDVAEKTIS